jgi:hypothetical protein
MTFAPPVEPRAETPHRLGSAPPGLSPCGPNASCSGGASPSIAGGRRPPNPLGEHGATRRRPVTRMRGSGERLATADGATRPSLDGRADSPASTRASVVRVAHGEGQPTHESRRLADRHGVDTQRRLSGSARAWWRMADRPARPVAARVNPEPASRSETANGHGNGGRALRAREGGGHVMHPLRDASRDPPAARSREQQPRSNTVTPAARRAARTT